jgi:hypothetical protein
MTCLGSTLLTIDEPNRTSSYAEEGTDYHELAAICLDKGTNAQDYIGHPMKSGKRFVDETNAKFLQDGYIEYVRQYAVGGTLLVEERGPISHLTGEPDAEGTSDAVVIRTDTELIIGDLKFGMGVEVNPEKNRQAMMYALAVIKKHELVTLVERIRIVIFQPRTGDGKPKERVVSMMELLAFGEEVKKTAAKIFTVDEFTGDLLFTDGLPLTPSEKACKFCKANHRCPALVSAVDKAMADGFENIEAETSAEIGGMSISRAEALGRRMDMVDLMEIHIKGVQQVVELELLAGKPVYGVDGPYKLVQGKKGNRDWTSDDDAKELFKQFRLTKKEMYKERLISPTDAEKLLKKDNPRCWVKCEKIIKQSGGKAHVANALDPRPVMKMEKPEDGFNSLEAALTGDQEDEWA